MVHDADSSPTARLLALWDHLGIRVAHVATQMSGDIAGLAAGFASRLGGVVLCVPSRLDPPPFETVADRLLMVCGERGLTADVTARAATRLRGATRLVLAGYDAPGWADVVADRTDEIARAMSDFLGRLEADAPASPSREGTHAGISYRVVGSGPALVLLPFFLAPSQWAPAVAQLARTFTVVTLGGPASGRRRRPGRSRPRADLPGDVSHADRPDGAGARRGDPRCGLRRRVARPPAGAAAGIRQRDHGDRREPVSVERSRAPSPRPMGSTDAFVFCPAMPRRCRSPTNRSTASFRSRCSRSATPTARWPKWCAWQGRVAGWASSCDRSTCRNGGASPLPARSWTR